MAVEIRALGPEEWEERLEEARQSGRAVRFGRGWDTIDLDDPNLPAHVRAMAEAVPAAAEEPAPAPRASWWDRLRHRQP